MVDRPKEVLRLEDVEPNNTELDLGAMTMSNSHVMGCYREWLLAHFRALARSFDSVAPEQILDLVKRLESDD